MPEMSECRWVDSHAHINLFDKEDVPSVLQRAKTAGVCGIIVPATGPDDFDRSVRLAKQFPDMLRTALGFHPHEAKSFDSASARRLEEGLEEEGVLAIGEIGLDYHYMNSPREDQLKALEWQLDLAIERDLPVILHNRESWDDMEALLRPRAGKLRGVCHSFTENPERVAIVESFGLFVGISGMVTFKQAENIRQMAAAVSLKRMLVETDSPFLAPVPHRGRQNEPAYVPLVGEYLADLHGINRDEMASITNENVRRLFGFEIS